VNNITTKHLTPKTMTKYRILEQNGKFYPQEKRFWLCGWVGFLYENSFNEVNFNTLEGAKDFIDIDSKKIPKPIIHEYNPQNNG
jgi:hypothetical protein